MRCQWKAFLNNPVKELVALDVFVGPMLSYTVLFLLVILAHERRRIVPVTATEHPTAAWTAQQVVDALPWDSTPSYFLRDRESVYQPHAQFVHDDQCWGHWAPKRADTHGRIYYLSPEVMLGNARDRAVEPARLRRVFRLRQLTRQVRPQGHIRLHNFGLYVDHGLSGQTVEVLIDDEAMRIEQAEHLPGVVDTGVRHQAAPDYRRGWDRPAALPSGAGDPADVMGHGARTDRLAHATGSTRSMGSPYGARSAHALV